MNKNIHSRRIVLLAFLVVAVTVGTPVPLFVLDCCYLLIVTFSAEKAREWIREAPSLDWGDSLDRSQWRVVLDSKESAAEALLQTTSVVPLTDKEAIELAGEPPIRPRTNTKPFLIRGVGRHVGTAGFEIYTNKNNDVTVIGGGLSDFPISPARRPIVVWLVIPPHEIYLWFHVAA